MFPAWWRCAAASTRWGRLLRRRLPRYEDELLKWMGRLVVDLQKRIDTNTERLKAAENPTLLAEDTVRGWVSGQAGRAAQPG